MRQLFETYIEPMLDRYQPRELLEIGVLHGAHTFELLRWCIRHDARLVSVDPAPWEGSIPEALRVGARGFRYRRGKVSEMIALGVPYIERICESDLDRGWRCYKQLSLDYLASDNFCGADACLLDGDHNYYTISRELALIDKFAHRGMLIMIHDVTNVNCARVDSYYDETTIPPVRPWPKAGYHYSRRGFPGHPSRLLARHVLRR